MEEESSRSFRARDASCCSQLNFSLLMFEQTFKNPTESTNTTSYAAWKSFSGGLVTAADDEEDEHRKPEAVQSDELMY